MVSNETRGGQTWALQQPPLSLCALACPNVVKGPGGGCPHPLPPPRRRRSEGNSFGFQPQVFQLNLASKEKKYPLPLFPLSFVLWRSVITIPIYLSVCLSVYSVLSRLNCGSLRRTQNLLETDGRIKCVTQRLLIRINLDFRQTDTFAEIAVHLVQFLSYYNVLWPICVLMLFDVYRQIPSEVADSNSCL